MPFFRPSNAFLNWHLPESGLPPVTLRMRPPSWGLTLRAVFLMVKRNTRKEHIHRMRTAALHFTVAMLLIAGRAPAQSPDTPAASTVTQPSATASPAVQQLLSFQPSEVKFPLHDLMDVLSDRRHEGWVLAAYPDPKTRQPLIGAGFSLDLPAREHPQRDQLNPHSFLEPSSADLWQAAGLQPARLQNILVDFQQHSASWTRKNRRAKINSLAPQISDEDANLLLRIASIQAIENARAYCRNFDRLSASLCQTVTGVETSQNMLEAVATRQLLLEPMDLEGHWFRYHHLLREYLCQRLKAQSGDEVAALHRRACQWYASQELWTDAVKHAIAADDTDEAIKLIGNCAMALVRKGDLLTLLGWQRHFPADLMRGQIDVRLAIAWGMALAMRFDEALAMLAATEHDTAAGTLPERENIHWECQAIRSVVTALQDDPQTALTIAQTCLDHPSTDAWTTNVVSNVVRFAHWKAGNLESLYATPWIPYSIEEDQRNVFSSVYRLCLLGLAEMQQMRFALAERYFMESMRLAEHYAGPQSTAAALCAPLIAQIRYEQGRLNEAEALIVDRMPAINAAVLLDSVLIAYLLLVRIAVSRSNNEQAYSLLDQAQTLGYTRRWDRLIAAALVERTRLQLAEGRMAEASACVVQLDRLAATYSVPQRSNSTEIDNYRALGSAYLAMAQNRMQDAVALFSSLLESAERRHSDSPALHLRITLAVACLGANERTRSVDVFREVLKAAATAGVYRTILDQGPEIGTLLHAVRQGMPCTAQTKALSSYIDHLLEGWRERYRPERRQTTGAERESLSARERNILELIAEGQSNKEIARILGIAPETVKSHVKSIFIKLSVDKRAHAVARAQALGLVRSR